MARFTLAWADIARENNLLKLLVFILAFVTLCLAVASVRLALRAPLIIERGCILKILSTGSSSHTQEEVETFIREAISQRFDSMATLNGDLLSIDELQSRQKEQEELKRREMKQRVLVNTITKSGDLFLVDTDRLLSVGTIRSVLIFPLQVGIESTTRSESNPYGLVLTKIKPVTSENKENKPK